LKQVLVVAWHTIWKEPIFDYKHAIIVRMYTVFIRL